MNAASKHYVLAAGGTGGHLIPAFALAHELERRGHHLALITDARGAQIPGKPDFMPAHVLPAGRFGKNPLKWVEGLNAVLQGRRMALPRSGRCRWRAHALQRLHVSTHRRHYRPSQCRQVDAVQPARRQETCLGR